MSEAANGNCRPEWLDQSFAESEQLTTAAAASSKMRIAFGERAGEKVRSLGRGFGYEDEIPMVKGKRCSSVNGSESLHEGDVGHHR